jgi:hypothetical protein
MAFYTNPKKVLAGTAYRYFAAVFTADYSKQCACYRATYLYFVLAQDE